MPDFTVGIRLESRATDGTDIAGIIKELMPEADVQAELDERGAVVQYVLTLHFDDADRATDAAFRLAEFFRSKGWSYEVADV